VHVTVWSDYICPWCYLGRDRTALLVERGCTVEQLPFELHPELPAHGRDIKPDGRTALVHDEIGRQCAEAGMPFRTPTHIPNSRRALATAEVVRERMAAASFVALDDALFRAHFVEGRDIGDRDELDGIVTSVGLDAARVRALVDDGEGQAAIDTAMERAFDHGVAGTPAWLFDDALVLPGVQPRELFERVLERVRARTGG
jgi:predicted DsbA family dithiol-disulfide isomerase